jgi:hypothetical protein
MRRRFALAVAVLLSAKSVAAEGVRISELAWKGTRSALPLFRAVTSGDFEGEEDVRIAMRVDPVRYRSQLAFARVASELGSRVVPRTEVYAVRIGDLLAAASRDTRSETLLREGVIQNDGKVTVLVSETIRRGRELDLGGPNGMTLRAWAEGRQPLVPEEQPLLADYVEMLVLDYLMANVGRRVVTIDAESHRLHLTDNGTAFGHHPDPRVLDGLLSQLKRVIGFPRRLMEKLRDFDGAKADQLLHAGLFDSWLVARHPISEMMDRRRAILSLVEARAAERADSSTIYLP